MTGPRLAVREFGVRERTSTPTGRLADLPTGR